jgi:uncharacterized membrane protein YkoI
MRRAFVLLAGLVVTVAGCNTSHSQREENEVEVTLDQLPPAVRDTINRESGGAPVGKIEREQEKGKTIYEAKITKGTKTQEVKIDESGKVVGRENE